MKKVPVYLNKDIIGEAIITNNHAEIRLKQNIKPLAVRYLSVGYSLDESNKLNEVSFNMLEVQKNKEKKMLTLPIKRMWYDLILSGEKTTEYRDFSKYYAVRLFFGGVHKIKLRNGYRKESPALTVEVKKIDVIMGTEESYLNPNKKYYAIRINRILEINL